MMEQKSDSIESCEQLRQEIVGGLLYCHHRANTNTSRLLEVTAFTYALIEVLLDKGLLTEEELNERKKGVGKRLVAKLSDTGMGVMLQGSEIDKYSFEGGARADCKNRLSLCRAACCRLGFALSQQDVREGIVDWDLSRPYMVRRRTDSYCTHFDRRSCLCTIYEYRPVPCRGYDCREDSRIWTDFAGKVISPGLETLFENPDTAEVNQHVPRP